MTEDRAGNGGGGAPIPVIFGEVLFDRFPDGSSVLGGAPFNVAWHLQGFGCAPLMVSRIGDDEPGRRVQQLMGEWGLAAGGLQVDGEHPTGAVEITFDGGQHSFEILPDQAYDHVDPLAAGTAAQGVGAALLYHGSLAARTAAGRTALEALHGRLAVPVFVDVNLRSPWWRAEDLPTICGRARWLKVNEEELEIIAAELGHSAGELVAVAQRLRAAFDIELLIVTRGDRGAFAVDRSGTLTRVEPQASLAVVDTIGAGDAFSSVVLLGLMRGWPLPAILERAQVFASRICEQRGATRTDPALYAELQGDWK